MASYSRNVGSFHRNSHHDGLWVLRTNTRLSTAEVAFQYKQLWMGEQAFRAVKSVLETRPICHKCDDTIRGHVFCSLLALMLMKELLSRLGAAGKIYEWEDIKRDLAALRGIELRIHDNGARYFLRDELRGWSFEVPKAAGVAVAPEPAPLKRRPDPLTVLLWCQDGIGVA